ncbi:MAG: hypothetical protein ACI8WB_000694 [Phenylobacterium sp.]|jgi:hypothetical protein
MLYNKLFAASVEQLLAGHFICPFAWPDEFRYLSNEDNFHQVQDYLRQVGKALTNAQDSYFYLSYIELEAPEKRTITARFKETQLELRPVVEFVALLMRARNSDATMIPGDEVRFSELLRIIEADSSLQKDLERLGFIIKSAAKEKLTDRLMAVFRYLLNANILIQPESTVDVYRATGKLGYIYDLMEFIAVNKPDSFVNEEQPDQGELI